MAIVDLFSKRLKRKMNDEVDVYQYVDIPQKFRVQVFHIITEGLEDKRHAYTADEMYHLIHKTLCKEYGVFNLKQYSGSDKESIFDFLLKTEEYEKALDVIEICFQVINVNIRQNMWRNYLDLVLQPDEAINELNERFKENAIGYRFESNQLIKIDSELIHNEIIKPTLGFLYEKKYKNANEEYLRAFEHFRHGRNKECLTDCLKSFESVLKIICEEKKWDYDAKDTSSKLIQICLDNDLIPLYMQNQFTSLRSLLESGIPTLRNRLGGHGQGAIATSVDDFIANYALNLTASNIKFLISLEKDIK